MLLKDKHRGRGAGPSRTRMLVRPAVALLAAAGLALGISTPVFGSPDPAPAAPARGETHTVESGDTLSRITARYGVPLPAVFALNGLGWNSVIHPGDVILLPSATAGSAPPFQAPPTARTHTVRSGDTLGRIAAQHGVPLQTLFDLNGLRWSSIIYPGDVIVLGPGGSSDAPRHPAPPPAARNPLTTGPNPTARVILTYDDCPRSLDAFADVVTWARSSDIGLVIAPTGACITSFQARYGVDIAALARANGQYVINHSISHPDLTTLSCAEAAAELGAPGVVTNFGRPPYGALDTEAYCGYAQVGMSPWLWSVDTRDWTGKSQAAVVASVVQQAQPGSTVLMHLHWNGFSTTAIGAMRDGLADRGMDLCRAYPGTSPVILPQALPC